MVIADAVISSKLNKPSAPLLAINDVYINKGNIIPTMLSNYSDKELILRASCYKSRLTGRRGGACLYVTEKMRKRKRPLV